MAHQTRSTEVDALLFSLLEVKFDITMVEQQGKIKIYQGEMRWSWKVKNDKDIDNNNDE